MKFKKLQPLTLAAAGFLVVAAAPSAQACEDCLDGYDGGEICWSGYASGGGSCTGGYGEPCILAGACSGGCDDSDPDQFCDSEAEAQYMCFTWSKC